MADFKTALEALGQGKVSVDALTAQLNSMLTQAPEHATRLLSVLDEALAEGTIDNSAYTELKRTVNEFRRTHTSATEAGHEDGGDATVFAQEDNFQQHPSDNDSDKTVADSGDATVMMTADEGESDFLLDGDDELSEEAREKIAAELSETTGNTDTSGVDFDLMTGDTTGQNTGVTAATGPAGTEWSDPSVQQGYTGGELTTGSVIKQRFKLLDVLGVGGMGKVYKGIDLLKQEARDKNPYVAIKLLNEDFKSHPEAFISLQRESSRQQKLAHPNIATVYDFDRVGGPGTPVYITMELMKGMELKDYIKKKVKKQGGLPFDEAFDIIRQLGDSLSYAHERRLVHSDFKPGNAFMCDDGTVKTLDFGIARAVKNPVTGEAEKTLFDPGQLGALTPAYASLEMLEGEEPDTRDDIYALGCVAYELLTGKHPFNKLPANKARDNNLVPPMIKGLKKKQNKALRRAVAFTREDRSQTVEQFITELEARYIWYKDPLTVAAMTAVLVGLGSIAPVMNYMENQHIEGIIADINSRDAVIIENKLAELGALEEAQRLRIASDAKEAIQDHFSGIIARLIDTSSPDYSFLEADKVVDRIASIYPETSFLSDQQDKIAAARKQKLGELYSEFTSALKDPDKIADSNSILDVIRTRIDPKNPLLTDARPRNAYRLLAEQAYESGDYEGALLLINTGLETAPDDILLQDARVRIEKAIQIASLQQTLEPVQSNIASLADFSNYEADIVKLANLNPTDPLILNFQTMAQGFAEKELENILQNGSRQDAETMANEYGELLTALQLNQELSQLKLAHLTGNERQAAIEEIAQQNMTEIERLLETPDLGNADWEGPLLANVQELDSLSAEDTSLGEKLASYRDKIATLYVGKAELTLGEERFDAARDIVEEGERYAPENNFLATTRDNIIAAKNEFDRKIRVAGLKEDFKAQTEANNVIEANQIFEQLKADLPEDDRFISRVGPSMLSESYEQLAQGKFEAKDYVAAMKLADAGMALDPNNSSLSRARSEYAVDAYIVELGDAFENDRTLDADSIKQKLRLMEAADGTRYSAFRNKSIQILTNRINSLKTTDDNLAASLALSSDLIFPGTSLEQLADELKLKPWTELDTANDAILDRELSKALQIQQAAADEFSGHPDFIDFSSNLSAQIDEANAKFSDYEAAKDAAGDDYDKLKDTVSLLKEALVLWRDNPDYKQSAAELKKEIIAAKSAQKTTVLATTTATFSGDSSAESSESSGSAAEAAKAEWQPVASDRPCTEKLAGYGKRSKAICYDFVNPGWTGPLMVVVPTSDSFTQNFAISKYEVSVNDFNKYCAVTGKCAVVKDKDRQNDPLTGISLAQAQEYASWLSERTGKTYRLPKTSEWEYAANAGGAQPQKDYNCRLSLGEKVIKGTGIVSVKSGRQNGWGLKNYVGNVQEWVVDGNATTARGGAFTDNHANCEISLQRSHDGSADDATGFRLVLEDAG